MSSTVKNDVTNRKPMVGFLQSRLDVLGGPGHAGLMGPHGKGSQPLRGEYMD